MSGELGAISATIMLGSLLIAFGLYLVADSLAHIAKALKADPEDDDEEEAA